MAFCKTAVFQNFIVVCFSKLLMKCFSPSHSMFFAIPQHPSTLTVCLVCWPKVFGKHIEEKKKHDEKSSFPFASVVVSFYYTFSFLQTVHLPTVPNPQRLPPSLAFNGTVPGTKHRAGEPKEAVGRAVKRGLPLQADRAVLQRVPFTLHSRSSGTSADQSDRNRSDREKC